MADEFTLGSTCLSAPELDLLRAIVRTSSALSGRWRITEKGGCDVLAVADPAADHKPLSLRRRGHLVQVARRGTMAEGPVLYCPIRADEVIELLLMCSNSDPTPLISAPAAPTEDSLGGERVYRLKRWPPKSLLDKNKHYTKLSAFLSRQLISLQELTRLSGVDEAKCWGLLMALDANHLLHTERRADAPGGASSSVNHKPNGFLQLLRKRLGLGSRDH